MAYNFMMDLCEQLHSDNCGDNNVQSIKVSLKLTGSYGCYDSNKVVVSVNHVRSQGRYTIMANSFTVNINQSEYKLHLGK